MKMSRLSIMKMPAPAFALLLLAAGAQGACNVDANWVSSTASGSEKCYAKVETAGSVSCATSCARLCPSAAPVCVTDTATSNFVARTFVARAGECLLSNFRGCSFIGHTRPTGNPAGAWTCAGSSSNFTNWAAGEPNNAAPAGHEEACAVVSFATAFSGSWNDYSCGHDGYCVCEAATTASCTRAAEPQCDAGAIMRIFLDSASCRPGSCEKYKSVICDGGPCQAHYSSEDAAIDPWCGGPKTAAQGGSIVLSFLMPVGIVFLILFTLIRRRNRRLQNLRAMRNAPPPSAAPSAVATATATAVAMPAMPMATAQPYPAAQAYPTAQAFLPTSAAKPAPAMAVAGMAVAVATPVA